MPTLAEAADHTFKIADAAIVFATLIGPILAVQAQKWLERGRIIKDRREAIFRRLMATRSASLSPAHIEALNAVPVEFYGAKRQLKEINDSWKLYLDYHIQKVTPTEAWWQKRRELFVELLFGISQFLGYKFSRAQLASDIYSPQAHEEIESQNAIIRQGFAKLFTGEAVVPMAVTAFPATASDEVLANQAAIQKALLEWLEGQRSVKVEQKPGS